MHRARVIFVAVQLVLASQPTLACTPTNEGVEKAWKPSNLLTGGSTKHPLQGVVLKDGAPLTCKNTSSVRCLCGFPDTVDVVAAIGASQIAILGEQHDNPVHHAFRALLLEGSIPNAKPIVFEQFRTDKQTALDAFAELQTKSPEQASLPEFKRLTDWEKSGWQQYNYDPLLQAALDAKLPLYAGDAPRAAMMKVAKEGEGALPADERARLKLDVPLGAKLDDASLTEIEEAHCKTMPKEALGSMAYAQRYRDATLADTVLKAADKHGSAILFAGNGHVRTDRGVPWYIRQRAPDKKVVAVMLIEVEDGKTDPEAYVPRDPDGKPAADYIIFTPRAEREDPCLKMRKRMGK